jgi:hypothetical protein
MLILSGAVCLSGGLRCCHTACFKGCLQGAFDSPDAALMKVEAIAHLGFQVLDEKVIECDLFKQVLDGLRVLFLHRLGLSIACCVEDDVIDALFATKAKLFLIPGDSLAFA